jgi:hypothetical protein
MEMTLSAKEIRAAAASVAGARGMGIETAASKAAPALLERAEAILKAMLARAASMEPSATDQAEERRYYAAASAAAAYSAAIDELRAALGLETRAEIAAREAAARKQAAREAAAAKAAAQVARTAACDAMPTRVVDARGQRVFIADATTYGEGRFSSLGGWQDGGEVLSRRLVMTAEDGRDVTGEVVATPEGEFRLQQPESRTFPNGAVVWYDGKLVPVETTATSDWLPDGAVIPPRRDEFSVALDWEAAEQAKADEAMAAELRAMPDVWLMARASLVEAFKANPSARFGGQNGKKYSVRDQLRADLDEYRAAQCAAAAEQAARMAASPFAALAALRRTA